MWWFFVLIGIVLVVGIVAAAVERRRGVTGPDAREDQYKNPSRAPSWRDGKTR